MKIAMAQHDLPNQSKGGVSYQAHYLANALSDRGHQVTMFTFSPSYPDCHYQVHQYVLPWSLPPALQGLKSFLFAGYLAQTDFSEFDVIHLHGDNYLLWKQHPQVRTFHGSAKDEAKSAVRLRRRLYQTVIAGLEQVGAWVADVNVGVSQATQARIPAVTTIVPCGVDTCYFYPGPKSEQPSILFVGTTGGRKRGNFLAEVFTQQVRSHFPNAELWAVTESDLVGDGIVNFGRASLETLTALYRRAWLFCLPSTYEGFGVPYIEAMASGTAVVASLNPGAREVLENGRYGLLADDDDLGTQLRMLLNEPEQRWDYAQKGLQRAQDFTWERVVKQYEQIYRNLITHAA
jgi:phosphatidyl-myo-inositol alpha-mannosyltransferase